MSKLADANPWPPRELLVRITRCSDPRNTVNPVVMISDKIRSFRESL